MSSRWTPAQLARAGSVVVVALALIVSVRLFVAIDAASHSSSDTLLGFVPSDIVIWAVALEQPDDRQRAARSAGR